MSNKLNNGDMPASPAPMNVAATQNHSDKMDAGFIDNFNPMIGMTKREAFAMAAMRGLVCATDPSGKWFHEAGDVAYTAVQYADALLAELAKDKS